MGLGQPVHSRFRRYTWEDLKDVLDFIWWALADIASTLNKNGSTDYSRLPGRWEIRLTYIEPEESYDSDLSKDSA